MMFGYGDTGWSGGGMLLMVILMVALFALAGWAVLRLGRRLDEPTRVDSPRQILDRRLATGEIDEQQYAQTRRLLDGRSVDHTPLTSRS